MYKEITEFIKNLYHYKASIPLHEPFFSGNEKKYVNDCIDSTFVSSVGEYVDLFEKRISDYTGAKNAVAVVNGTAALHISLLLCGVKEGDEVLTQPLSFIATSNAITYCNANPVFIDVDKYTMGLSSEKLENFLHTETEIHDDEYCYNRKTGNKISACVPMHTFGHSVDIEDIIQICDEYHIPVIEDAAESLGSKYKKKYTGTFGKAGVFSFNGNKTITTGGGGMIITDDDEFAKIAKYLTTTAKVPHPYELIHDRVGYNYRMPNINAALGCAQMEKLDEIVQNKKETAEIYKNFFQKTGIDFFFDDDKRESNYWLNVLILKDKNERDIFLKYTNDNGVMTRPAWELTNRLKIYKDCFYTDLSNSEWLGDRIVNIPSSFRNF